MLRRSYAAELPTSPENVFRFNIQSEPESLDPIRSSTSISSYLLNLLYVPLMRYQESQLTPYGAKKCQSLTSTHYRCDLREDWRWSDGQPVRAEQFVSNWQEMKKTASPRLSSFKDIRAVVAKSSTQLDFILSKPDSEFLYRLIDPAMSPRRAEVSLSQGTLTTGPYVIKKHAANRSYFLSPTTTFFLPDERRPAVEVLIVDSENTALSLFETKKINFVRRLTAENIPFYKNKPGFKQIPLHRFDYIGLNQVVAKDKVLSENLIYAVQPLFKSFAKLFDALGPPGCMGLVTPQFQQPVCYNAKKVTRYTTEQIKALPKIKLSFAVQAGDDIRRGMELFHSGWKKNLNLDVELSPMEWGVLTALLKSNPPTLFRRGVPLERPTCLAALEVFESTSPDNFIGINDKDFDSTIRQLREGRGSLSMLCQKGLQQLLDMHRIIPMGQLHFTVLSDNKFDGIRINELNQIDLSGLKPKAAR